MSAKKLGGTMQDEIRPQCKGILIHRGSDSIINNDYSPYLVSSLRQPSDIKHFQSWISWRLQIQDMTSPGYRGLDGLKISGITQGDFYLKAREKFEEELIGSPVGIFHRNNPISWREEREQGITDGCHSRCKAGGSFRAFKLSDFLLKDGDRRIRTAAIDMARFFPQRHILPGLDISIAKRDTVNNRNLGGSLPEQGIFTSPHRQSRKRRMINLRHDSIPYFIQVTINRLHV